MDFFCCTELLQQTKFVYAHKNLSKRAKNASLFCTLSTFWHCFTLLWPIFCMFWHIFDNKYKCCLSQWLSATKKIFVAVTQCDKQKNCLFRWLKATNNFFFCRSDSVWQTKKLFVAVTQCDKQKNCLSQWLSATNKKNCLSQWLSATNKSNHCGSDSVQETILIKNIQFLCCMLQRHWKKSQKQTAFQIWISPPR